MDKTQQLMDTMDLGKYLETGEVVAKGGPKDDPEGTEGSKGGGR